jgi:serine/threonine-protein kinase
MNDVSSKVGDSLPVAAALRIDDACQKFEAAWKAGQRPRIEQYLCDAVGVEREVLLRELTRLEKELRGHVQASTLPLPTRGQAAPSSSARGCELLEEIGRGGIGVVYRGRDRSLRRELAVKLLREEHRQNPDLARRFMEEAQIGGQLQHPGIAPVYELGEFPDGRPYFTMKLIRGRTLANLLGRRKVPADELPHFIAIFEQVCQTLAYAHAHGVIHRDLKPHNVMVGEFGEVQVMDWGLAKVLASGESPAPEDAVTDKPAGEKPMVVETLRDSATQDGRVMGTYAYMPREQARGEAGRLDERCDVFGLGAILCEILTGLPPYTGGNTEVRRQAEAGDLGDAFSRLDRCGADPELVRIARGCLAAQPAGRPRDATSVAAAVTAYLAGVQERLRRAELAKTEAEARGALVDKFLQWAGGEILAHAHNEALARVNEGNYAEARLALRPIEGLLVGELPVQLGDLRAWVDTLRADLDALFAFDEARLEATVVRLDGNGHGNAQAARRCAAAFSALRIPIADLNLDEGQLSLRVSRRAIRLQLVEALDDWTCWTQDAAEARRLTRVAELADPEPQGPRSRARRALRDGDAEGLRQAAAKATAGQEPPGILLGRLAAALGIQKRWEEAAEMLEAARVRHPSDFWLNHDLGLVCLQAKPARKREAVRYLSVAAALRPRCSGIWVKLGNALCDLLCMDERNAHRKLWADVEALLKQSQQK